MVAFRVNAFKGIRPRLRSRLLPHGEAQTATDVRLGSGALEPWSVNSQDQAESTSGVQSIYRIRNDGSPLWLESTNDVDYAPGPLPDDTLERTYYTGETQPRMTYIGIVDGTPPLPDDYRYLGVPAPDAAPTLSGDSLPSETVTGQITAGGFNTNTLKADFSIEANLPANMRGWFFGGSSGYETTSAVHTFNFNLPAGTELRVTAVPSSNEITVEEANGAGYIAQTTVQDAKNDAGDSSLNKFRTEDTGTSRTGHFRFYIPNGITITSATHGLQVDDVIRITSVDQTIAWSLTQPAVGSSPDFNSLFFGWESDNGHADADADVDTWPTAPSTFAIDSFYLTGSGYAFVDIWVDLDGSGSSSSFSIDGQFSWELSERDGVEYEETVADIETRVYVYTYVSELGEEGPPSDPSAIVTIPTDGTVEVTMTGTPPTTQRQIDNWRIYRANTGTEVTEFQFVAEEAIGTTTYDDTSLDYELGEVLQTTTWDPPPTGLTGIVAGPNGMLAGFVGKDVYLSEPGFPHAWPPEYKQSVAHDVVGIGVLPNGFAILTKGTPYALVGDHPRAMSQTHYQFSQSCVSKRSIINTINSVIYASPDGLVEIGLNGFKVLTEELMGKREWQAFNPDTLIGAWHDNKYFGFYDTGGFVYDPFDDSVGFTTLSISTVEAVFVDPEADLLYVLDDDSIDVFDSSPNDYTSAGELTWKSGKLICPHPVNLGAARLEGASYPITFTLYNDQGDTIITKTVADAEVFRLPGDYVSNWFEFQVVSDDVVELVHIAETVEELLEG